MLFASQGVDKGSALQQLCDHLNIPIQETIAFGDGENDKEFLVAAGLGCAMKNARPAAKSAANIVIEVIQSMPIVAYGLWYRYCRMHGRLCIYVEQVNIPIHC